MHPTFSDNYFTTNSINSCYYKYKLPGLGGRTGGGKSSSSMGGGSDVGGAGGVTSDSDTGDRKRHKRACIIKCNTCLH